NESRKTGCRPHAQRQNTPVCWSRVLVQGRAAALNEHARHLVKFGMTHDRQNGKYHYATTSYTTYSVFSQASKITSRPIVRSRRAEWASPAARSCHCSYNTNSWGLSCC